MNAERLEKMLFNLMNAPLNTYPYPHLTAQDVFPNEIYEELLSQLPPLDLYTGINETGLVKGNENTQETRYMFRFAEDMGKLEGEMRKFWEQINAFINSNRFAIAMMRKFHPFVAQRFQEKGRQENISFRLDLLRDFTGYELGPHTDLGRRLLNVFFYLPKDDSRPDLGTSIYIPRDPNFTCTGGPHYQFKDFINVATLPAKRNTAVAFFRTSQSFHGVEPITEKGIERNAMALSMYAD